MSDNGEAAIARERAIFEAKDKNRADRRASKGEMKMTIEQQIATECTELIGAMQNQACLSKNEAIACLRDFLSGSDFSGEAVNHYGGTSKVINDSYLLLERG